MGDTNEIDRPQIDAVEPGSPPPPASGTAVLDGVVNMMLLWAARPIRGAVEEQLFIPSRSVSAHSMARIGHADLGNAANMWIDKGTVEGCMGLAGRK